MKWKICFHPDKCNIIHLTRRQQTNTYAYKLHDHILEEVKQARYLGVTISNDLKWGPHINQIATKANKALGFLRRNLKINNKGLKQAAFKAFVRPVLEYSSSVWDPHTEEDSHTLEKVQRRAARWVTNRCRQTSSVGEMLNDLKWTSLEKRRKLARLTTFYKVHHGLLKITSKFAPTVSASKRQTRRSHQLHYNIPSSRTSYRQKSFFPRTIPEWNLLPEAAASAPSLATFRSRLVYDV